METGPFIILVCLPHESCVYSECCKCEVPEPLEEVRVILPRGEPWATVALFISSELQLDSLGFRMTQSCLWSWGRKGGLPLEWGL